jgi:hypothetical protein
MSNKFLKVGPDHQIELLGSTQVGAVIFEQNKS